MTFSDTFGLPPDTQQDALPTSASLHLDFVVWRKGRRRMAACPGFSPIQLEARQVTLMTYEASAISGPLRPICAFDLTERRLQVLDAEAMRPLLG